MRAILGFLKNYSKWEERECFFFIEVRLYLYIPSSFGHQSTVNGQQSTVNRQQTTVGYRFFTGT
jgi:hypothetical protein